MGNRNDNSFDLEKLLLCMLSNEVTDDELALLNESLAESAELRARACRFLCDESLLSDVIGTNQKVSSLIGVLAPAEDAKPGGQLSVQPGSLFERTLHFINHHGVAVGAIAAALLIGLFAYNLSLMSKLERLHTLTVVAADEGLVDEAEKQSVLRKGDTPKEIVGRISGLKDATWAAGQTPLRFGERIKQGQVLHLDSGLVELLLATGAKVTIEGPAEFEATSTTETLLTRGKIAAAAPRAARGYTVLTPTAEMVDIGTQFGVLVDDAGESELHVFDGDVVARSRLATDHADLIHAKQEQGMRFSSASAEPTRFPARKIDFARHVAPLHSPEDLPPIPSTDGLTLWYAADMCRGLAEGDPVSTWRDLLVGDNDFADDAWQFEEGRRPTFVRDGAGRAALRFNGWSTYLATSPMEPTERQTMFMVCALAPISYANEHHGQMLLKYGEAPSVELSVLSDFSARGWVWPGTGKSNVGVVQSKPIETSKVAVIAYEYSTADNRSRLWVNGVQQADADAPVPVLQSGCKYIGSHHDTGFKTVFFGNIYEVAIIEETLDENRMSAFWNYFSKRYEIE